MSAAYQTKFGSLQHYEKGGVQAIADDVKNYAFSNCFEIASKSKPYEKVVFGQNQIYVLECLRAEGASPWYTCAHDEFALVMDGEVEIRLLKLDKVAVPAGAAGSVGLAGTPTGRKMGVVRARRGHMTLLPVGSAYQFHAAKPGVVLLQTLVCADTVERWAEICQIAPRPTR